MCVDTPRCYTFPMPTSYRRLGVVRDPDLDRALDQTRGLLGPQETRSAAAQVRALALRGARSVLDERGSEGELLHTLNQRYGARPAKADLVALGTPPGTPDPQDPTPASDALSWVRGD
jgi:hypothetical protein